jgi:hypothetical protein
MTKFKPSATNIIILMVALPSSEDVGADVQGGALLFCLVD